MLKGASSSNLVMLRADALSLSLAQETASLAAQRQRADAAMREVSEARWEADRLRRKVEDMRRTLAEREAEVEAARRRARAPFDSAADVH